MSMDLSLGEELDNEEYYTELLGQDADTQDWNNVPSETYKITPMKVLPLSLPKIVL